MLTAYHAHPRERRYAGLALTVLVHAALLQGWQMSRHTLPVQSGPEPKRTRIQWIRLPSLEAPAPHPSRCSCRSRCKPLPVSLLR